MRLWTCAVLLSALLCGSTAGAAPSARKRARALFIKGNKLFAKKDYKRALKQYRAARRLYASYKIDFNIGTTLELMKLPHLAAEHFEKFVMRADRDKDMRIVKMAWAKLLTLRKRLVRISVHCRIKGTAVRVGERAVGTTPLRLSLYMLPGEHRVVFSSPGRADHTWVVKAAAGSHQRHLVPWVPLLSHKKVKPVFRDPPPPRRRQPATTPFYKTWWFWTGVGVFVTGAAVTGGVLGTRGDGGDGRMPQGELGEIR